jgi:hypothetical protein
MDQLAVPPKFVQRLLRLDGLAVLVASVAAFAFVGGNWWLFSLLILAPDLAFLTIPLGTATMAKVYDVVHSYALPFILGAIGLGSGIGWMLPVALIWAAHIGADRALGYGLKYPEAIETTHLGLIGRTRKAARANAR